MSQSHILRRQAEQLAAENPALAEAVAQVVQEMHRLDDGEPIAGLTLPQRHLFDFLITYIDRYGISPSYSEICDQAGFCRSNVARLLGKLRERGYISFVKNRHRAITILPAARDRLAFSKRSVPERRAA